MMQVMKYQTFKKRPFVFLGLIIVKLGFGIFSVSHIETPVQLLSQCIEEMILRQFDQFC